MKLADNGLSLSSNESKEFFLKIIQAGNDCPVTGSGNSMRPFLNSKEDIILMTPVDRKQVQRGDIILYRRLDGGMVIHRVLKKCTDNTFWFVGDNQCTVEKNVDSSQLIAKAKAVLKHGKVYNCEKGITRKMYTVYMIVRVTLYRFLLRSKVFLTHLNKIII